MKDRFRKIMTDHGLTQQKMAEMIGIDTSTVSCFCNGKRQPGFEVIAKISSAFPDVDMNWFINGDSRAIVGATGGVGVSNGSGATVNGAGGALGAGSGEESDREQLSLDFNAPSGATGAVTGAGSNISSGAPTGASGAPAGANLGSLASPRPGDYASTPSGRRQIKRVILFFEDGGIESYE